MSETTSMTDAPACEPAWARHTITPQQAIDALAPIRDRMRGETSKEYVIRAEAAYEEWGPVCLFWASEEIDKAQKERDEAKALAAARLTALREVCPVQGTAFERDSIVHGYWCQACDKAPQDESKMTREDHDDKCPAWGKGTGE